MAKTSEWTKFVQKIFKERKCKTLGEAMQIASTLKKQGKYGSNANKSVNKSMNKSVNKSMKKGKKGKTRRN
jgi:hypothetical protein